MLNGGTVGGGGAGNFHENQPYGLAILTYERGRRSSRWRPTWCASTRRDGTANAERRLLGTAKQRQE